MPETESLPFHTLAHDLRQPLRSILLTAQKLQRNNGLPPELVAELETIVRGAQRQDQLLTAAMEFEDAADFEDRSTLPLPLAVQTACMKVEAFRKEQDGLLRSSVPEGLNANVPAAAIKALEKVLHNALKFHAPGTKPVVDVEARAGVGGGVVITVRDNGIGVEPQYHERIFQPFSRLNPPGDFPGSGLGLAAARRLLATIDGRLAITTPLNSTGAVFELHLAGDR